MTDLQFTSCKECHTTYLVGIDGHDVRGNFMKGGMIGDTPYIAIGNDEIDESRLPDIVPCKKCGEPCKVETSEPVSQNATE